MARRRNPLQLGSPRPLIEPRLLRREQAAGYLSVSGAQLDLFRRADPQFPKPISLPSTRNPGGAMRVPLWDKADLDRWIEVRKKEQGDVA